MELERFVPSQNFVTGFVVETRSFTWTIENFHLVRKDKSMINSQKIDFIAGETTGHLSHWTAFLEEQQIDDTRWIGFSLKLNERTTKQNLMTDANFKASYSELRLAAKNKEGGIIKSQETGPIRMTEYLDYLPMGYVKCIDADDDNDCPEKSLVIHVTFSLYTPSQSTLSSPLEAIMERFQVKFAEKARKDLAGLLKNPIPCNDIKIISNDKMEFTVQRGILAARSGVFAAMLSCDMIEANSGVIELPDISSNALEVLLNFLYTGELLPTWNETEVLVELTNAAGKYQLDDLLQFLDVTLGKVCQLQNVGALVTLARQLSLKVAEEELMLFVREKGVGSADNFVQMWNTELPATDEESDEPNAKKAKLT